MKNLIRKFIPDFLISWYHFLLALLGAIIYGFASRKLRVIGVTGTKGKSTVVILLGKILEEAKYKVGWISSLNIKIGEKERVNPYHMTMPGRFFIQKTLAQMMRSGCHYAIIEVTSEGIKQHRHRFINFTGVVFTNLAPEHIEAHGGFKKYQQAKGRFFEAVSKNKESFGIYNLDDDNVEYFLGFPIAKKYGYRITKQKLEIKSQGLEEKVEVIEARIVKTEKNWSSFMIRDSLFKIPLMGEFNIYNALAAITAGIAQGVSLETARGALEKVKVIPGRLEMIDEGQDFSVVVDLAHTPDSFEKVFRLFKILPHQRILAVFGSAGGGRDKWKRPELGRIASENSDTVIITNEDPYGENPLEIANEVAAGCRKIKPEIILDRGKAIFKALSLAQKGDIVLVLGKGTEQTMVIDNKKYKWDDRRVVREELRKLTRH